jgi:hypothetical protein
MASARATAAEWSRGALAPLDLFVLTDGEEAWVDQTLDLIVTSVRAGEISGHFAHLMIRQLAEEVVEGCLARLAIEGGGADSQLPEEREKP